eukprot:TRINITY_DN5694_c0_g1_i2.p1 TRINITY_DN5694_c0_g1~~TRINITY_DN5694_c0_g1_i2.p1  ORF type:complete len:477 (+),score=128.59 TRINITY_DN5694_c0_g1_i2:102-1433(+)
MGRRNRGGGAAPADDTGEGEWATVGQPRPKRPPPSEQPPPPPQHRPAAAQPRREAPKKQPAKPAPPPQLPSVAFAPADSSAPAPPYQPRGMVNERNCCYLNATVQALFACPPFRRLAAQLPQLGRGAAERLPHAAAVRAAADAFGVGRPAGSGGYSSAAATPRELLDAAAPHFDPARMGQQADAHEYLLMLLGRFAAELALLRAPAAAPPEPDSPASPAEEAGWATAGRGGKSLGVEHDSGDADSDCPVQQVFGGAVSSRLQQSKCPASVTKQPCIELCLEVLPESCRSVESCIAHWAAPEDIDLGSGGRAKKQQRLSQAPRVLLLCLKRWSASGGAKCVKPIQIPEQLTLPPHVLGPGSGPLRYSLCSVIMHRGETPRRGHYTAALRGGDGRWRLGQLADAWRDGSVPYLLAYAAAPQQQQQQQPQQQQPQRQADGKGAGRR